MEGMMQKNAYAVRMPTGHGARVLVWVCSAISTDPTREELQHVFVDRSEDKNTLIGCDGRRLHAAVWDTASMGALDLPQGTYRVWLEKDCLTDFVFVPVSGRKPYPNYREADKHVVWSGCPNYYEYPVATRDKALFFAARKGVALNADYLAAAMGLSGCHMEGMRVSDHHDMARVEYCGGSYALLKAIRHSHAYHVELAGKEVAE